MKHLLLLAVLMVTFSAHAQVDTNAFHQALKIKKNLYYTDGTISGGDRGSADFRVTQIRSSANPEGYDRIVLDFAGNSAGEKTELARPPYFQVENNSSSKTVNVTLYGKPKLEFSTANVVRAAKKTKNVSRLDLLPVVEQDRWTFSIKTSSAVKVEVFELTEPARVIIDLKR